MKKNKKAIFGLAIAMIFSLAFMQGINQNNKDFSMQQVSLSCACMANHSESTSGTVSYGTASAVSGCFASYFIVAGFATTGSVVGAPVGLANFCLAGICTL